jgi:hypothetical protein
MAGVLLVAFTVVLAAVAWVTYLVVAIDEDCGRFDECALPVDPLYFAAWGLTGLAALVGFVVLLRWVRRGRKEMARGEDSPTLL